METIVTHNYFELLTMMVIILNSLVLAFEHYGQSKQMADTQEMLNIVFTQLFSLEVVLKIIGIGFVAYFTSVLNLFDFCVVVISWIEVYWFCNSSSSGSMGLTILRGFRLLRIFKLIRSWKSLRRILKTLFSALPEAANLFFLIAIYIFVNGLVGR